MQKLRQLSSFAMVSGLTLRSANHVRSMLAGQATIHSPITLNRPLRDSTKKCNTPLRNIEMRHWVAKQFSRAISRSSSIRKTMAAMYHGSAADPGFGRWVHPSSLFPFCLFPDIRFPSFPAAKWPP